jgi:hypothetical protein
MGCPSPYIGQFLFPIIDKAAAMAYCPKARAKFGQSTWEETPVITADTADEEDLK